MCKLLNTIIFVSAMHMEITVLKCYDNILTFYVVLATLDGSVQMLSVFPLGPPHLVAASFLP